MGTHKSTGLTAICVLTIQVFVKDRVLNRCTNRFIRLWLTVSPRDPKDWFSDRQAEQTRGLEALWGVEPEVSAATVLGFPKAKSIEKIQAQTSIEFHMSLDP